MTKIYLGFNAAFNTVQVISRRVVLWAEEISTYSWSRFCKLLKYSKKLPTLPYRVQVVNRQPQRWEASLLPLRHPLMTKNEVKLLILDDYRSDNRGD